MAKKDRCQQLIGGDGKFCASKFKEFVKVGMDNWGRSYTVVSIMGAQSSGKSTLLNNLFGTKFGVMNALEGRKQTTRGIWVAISDPRTLVVDMEGTDGRERGENNTRFEKWSALFALAISDIVLFNMLYNEIGRENAASKPLLRTVLKVMPKICSPRKATLIFVIRDHFETPLELLRKDILGDIEKIWNSTGSRKKLEEFFDVKVEALCNYHYEKDRFKKEVARLKETICGVVSDKSEKVPASSFPSKAGEIWENIKDNKDLKIYPMKEPGSNWNRRQTAAVAVSVAGALITVGIAAAGLAIPGMQTVAVVMIPVVAGIASQLFATLRGGN